MGCDIHAYIEFQDTYDVERGTWSSFGGQLYPGRDYRLFARLAGVRGEQPVGLVAPRGIPDKLGWDANEDWWLTVAADGDAPGTDLCPISRAEEYVRRYGSRFSDASKRWVSNPDWHTPSWLTLTELIKVVRGCNNVRWQAILAAMAALPNARLVFWFDN